MDNFAFDAGIAFSIILPVAILLLLGFSISWIMKKAGTRILRRLSSHQPEWLNILLSAYLEPAAITVRVFFVYLALFILPLGVDFPVYRTILTKSFHVATAGLMTWGGWRSAPVCRLLLSHAENKLDLDDNNTMNRFFENIYRVLVMLLGGIVILDLLGVPVTGFITGAGIAGLAVSLAAQSTLSNLIAGVALVVERPFAIGDYVILGGFEGTVEDISFRSTKLRTPDKVLISVENAHVCEEYIQNVTNRSSRLWQFNIGLTYSTTRQQIEAICADLIELFNAQPEVVPGTVSVNLTEFASSSVNVLVRVYLTTVAYADFLQFKNRLNLEIMELVQRNGASFAFPSQTVYLEQ